MATILPPSGSPSEAARAARASAFERTNGRAQPQAAGEGTAPPTASGAWAPAVVNHVGGADSTEAGAAARGASAVDRTAAGATVPEDPNEAHAEEIRALAKRDAEVRAHEQAHAAAGGAFAGAPSYSYQRGPDGRSYAVGGEVPIDVSAVAGDPEATIQKMQQVKRAALAPRDPSDADRAIASSADALILAARRELMTESAQAPQEAAPTAVASSSQSADVASAGSTAREAFHAYRRRDAEAAYAPTTMDARQSIA